MKPSILHFFRQITFSFLFILSIALCHAQVVYSVDDLNLSSPQIIKTNDGGYLINTYRSNYTPNSTPIEGTSRYRLIKINSVGDTTWTALNDYFSPVGMLENSDGSFASITGKYTSDFFICDGTGFQWGDKILFTKIDAAGNLLNEFELNPGCVNVLGSVMKVDADRYAVACTYYNVLPSWVGLPPDGHLFFMDDNGNITQDQIYTDVVFDKSDLFMGDQGDIHLIYEDSNGNLALNTHDDMLNLISSTTLPNTTALFPPSSEIQKIEGHKQPLSGNISVAISYYSFLNNITYHLKTLTFDANFNLIDNYDYAWSRYNSERLNYEMSDYFVVASTVDNNGNSDIQLNLFDPNGLKTDSTTLDIISDRERASALIFDYNGEILIGGSFNCCNLDVSFGPAQSFISFGYNFITDVEDQTSVNDIQVFPNPTTGNLQVQSSLTKIVSVDIYDLTGRIVHSAIDKNGINRIAIPDIPSGVYAVLLKDGNNKSISKRIVLK